MTHAKLMQKMEEERQREISWELNKTIDIKYNDNTIYNIDIINHYTDMTIYFKY